ncbi:ACT domain-containing protein [Anaeromicrobium sediminis]
MIDIFASISSILAQKEISIFAVSTYDTDYILVKTMI